MRVQLFTGRNLADERILLDGVDISSHVLRDSVELDMSQAGMPRVTMTLIPDRVEVDGDAAIMLRRLEQGTAQ